ncbi:MAG: serine hydrolase domain-containing protein [Chryseolinea sp.]
MLKFAFLLLVVPAVLLSACQPSTKASETSDQLEHRVDSLVKPYIDSTRVAGIAIGIFKDHKPLLLKSYGYADLELNVKLPVDASFEIGSVTKQFTAAAIMQLSEEKKLSLDDDFTKYVQFNTRGRKVTIRQLLSHTSGIKGYTELPSFGLLATQKLKRDTLLRMVEKESFDFEPGEALIYNNTAFFILGLVIEKVSGQSYEDYVAKNLFAKAGMSNTYYCNERKITRNRAHGYDGGESGLVRAAYLDHTWPYSAGSLCSTVEDLEKWNDALHHGKILSDAAYKEFITPVSLNDGTVTHYAKGVTVTQWKGRRLIEHGGGIFGFLSQNSYFPDENLSIVVLINSTTVGPRGIADELAAFVFGPHPQDELKRFEGSLSKYKGSFAGRGRGSDVTITISDNDTTLLVAMDGGKPNKLRYVKDNEWTDEQASFIFDGDEKSVTGLRVDQTYGYLRLKRR